MKRQLFIAHISLSITVVFAACKPSRVWPAVCLHKMLGSGVSGPGRLSDFNPNCPIPSRQS